MHLAVGLRLPQAFIKTGIAIALDTLDTLYAQLDYFSSDYTVGYPA